MTIDLDELERIGKAASDPPWSREEYRDSQVHEDAVFIVEARNHWQSLIDRIRELEAFADKCCPKCDSCGALLLDGCVIDGEPHENGFRHIKSMKCPKCASEERLGKGAATV